jgi:DNA-binding transcriptional ArsR family regulator
MSIYIQQAKVLRAMGHPVRLQIMETLANGPACVCELIMKTGQRQACISQHLMLLRRTGLVKRTRMGLNMNYELATGLARDILKDVIESKQAGGPRKLATGLVDADDSIRS